eukprot:Awhi_evm1s13830
MVRISVIGCLTFLLALSTVSAQTQECSPVCGENEICFNNECIDREMCTADGDCFTFTPDPDANPPPDTPSNENVVSTEPVEDNDTTTPAEDNITDTTIDAQQSNGESETTGSISGSSNGRSLTTTQQIIIIVFAVTGTLLFATLLLTLLVKRRRRKNKADKKRKVDDKTKILGEQGQFESRAEQILDATDISGYSSAKSV